MKGSRFNQKLLELYETKCKDLYRSNTLYRKIRVHQLFEPTNLPKFQHFSIYTIDHIKKASKVDNPQPDYTELPRPMTLFPKGHQNRIIIS